MTIDQNLQPVSVIIVEDEPHSRESLVNLLRQYCHGAVVLEACDGIESGLRAIQDKRPDLVFLDIEMPGGTGFDLLERVAAFDFEVIFTTAFEHYALKAIKFSALDYLLKPIDVTELAESVDKVRQKRDREKKNLKLLTLLENMNRNKSEQTITLATSEGLEFIRVSNILYCEASGSYTRFHLKEQSSLLVSKHLKEYEHLLEDLGFYRSHNSYLVNLTEVRRFVKGEGGYLVMNNGDQVGISDRRKETLLRMFENAGSGRK